MALVVILIGLVGLGVRSHWDGWTRAFAASSHRPQDEPCPAAAVDVVREAPAVRGASAQATTQKSVALTFDDGPGPWTPQVLAILKRKGVRATFFVIGRQAAAQPNTIRKIADAGHLVENHTWSHRIPSVSRGWQAGKLTSEMARTSRAITAAGAKACLFRPPGGVVKGALQPARAAGLSTVLWSVDTRDWDAKLAAPARRAEQIRHRAQAGLSQPHPILLLHDGGGDRAATVAALPGIIDDFRAKGYRFVRMDGRP